MEHVLDVAGVARQENLNSVAVTAGIFAKNQKKNSFRPWVKPISISRHFKMHFIENFVPPVRHSHC